MNLVPIAAPPAPGNVTAADDPAAAGSGDFTALLALLVGTASTTLPLDNRPVEPGAPAASPLPPPSESIAEPGATLLPQMPTPTAAMSQASAPDAPIAAMTSAAPAPVTGAPVAEVQGAPIGQVSAAPGATAVIGDEPNAPAEAPTPRSDSRRAQPATPAVPANPANPADRAQPAISAQPAEPAAPAQRGEPVVGAPVEASVPTSTPTGASDEPQRPPTTGSADEPERRPVTMTLPDAARFERPPLGGPAATAPRTEWAQHPLPPASSHERLPVDVEASEHPGALPSATAVGHPTAPAGASATPAAAIPFLAATRAEAPAAVDAPPAAPAPPVPVPDQIVSAVVPLHGRGDGRHEVTLELRPHHLGSIRVEVSVEHQTVHLILHAAEPATSRLLSAALPELRAALADAGLTAGHVGVGLDGGGGARHRRQTDDRDRDLHRPAAAAGAGGGAAHEPGSVRTPRPAAAGRLDLFL
ncbi:MAG: flagellar hook-length control protein FliK [Actinomycetota bacterium]